MPQTVVVCLPTDTDQLASSAIDRLTTTPHTSTGTVGYFTASTRWRRGQLLHPRKGTAAGGPVRLLDLTGMRTAAGHTAWHRWHIWQRVVAGTPAAKPFWEFSDRHRADPVKYPLERAQRQYLAQPRIAAMRVYNATPTVMALPTEHLEAFQAGAQTYAQLAWLSAAPGQAMITLDEEYLTATGGHLADHISYLESANNHINQLDNRDHLVALATH